MSSRPTHSFCRDACRTLASAQHDCSRSTQSRARMPKTSVGPRKAVKSAPSPRRGTPLIPRCVPPLSETSVLSQARGSPPRSSTELCVFGVRGLAVLLLIGVSSSGRGGCPLGWPLGVLAPSREGVVPLRCRNLPLELFSMCVCGQHAAPREGWEGRGRSRPAVGRLRIRRGGRVRPTGGTGGWFVG